MTAYQFISVVEEPGTFSVVLNRPPLNVLNIPMMKEFNAALSGAKTNTGAKVVIIRAEGKAFSAGVDIADHTADRVGAMMDEFGAIFRNISGISVPTLAVVDGAALGGGCEIVLACDMIVASERSKFGQPEIKVGVFPPVAAAIVPRLIGRNRALEFLMSGEPVGAAEAERMGMINRTFPVESFAADVKEFVARLTARSRVILEMTKRAVDTGIGVPCMEAIGRAERIYMDEMMKTEDASEGLRAFMEKRSPVWKNR
ncbi:MAG TPA: enoyl-CoA hydratase-related protein [Bacteroidota bacterium]|nr:enoyl-CoA hydratase-related protein [Bacteroidota bacterium]